LFVFYPLRITSNSMAPFATSGDWVVIDAQSLRGRGSIRRGDVVLFKFPFGTDGRAIKRVVGIAGDVFDVAGKAVVVPVGHLFLVGDNAASSLDSREFGPVPATEIVGQVLLVIPLSWHRYLTDS
jgi:signal peptidase I